MPWDNSCLAQALKDPPTANAPAEFLPHCASWVINTTDAVWLPTRSDEEVSWALHEYFYEQWESTSNGRYFRGMDELEKLVFSTRRTFPDLRIHITDVTCIGNDIDGYKTIMPDVLVGTHLGPSALFGAATGASASWSGMALCYVQKVSGKWQYVAEWVVHDELAVAQQLGRLDYVEAHANSSLALLAQPHDCAPNVPSWGWTPPEGAMDTASQTLEQATAGHVLSGGVDTPDAKRLVIAMDAVISEHVSTYDWPAWKVMMEPFWAPDFVYDSTIGTGVWTGLKDWFCTCAPHAHKNAPQEHPPRTHTEGDAQVTLKSCVCCLSCPVGEHVIWNDAFSPVHFTQIIFAGEELSATTTTFATITWRAELAGVPASGAAHRMRISDYYKMAKSASDGPFQIQTNYMMLDIPDLCRASGRRVLPHAAALPDDGAFAPSRVIDGVPAPISAFVSPEERTASRAVVDKLLSLDWALGPPKDMLSSLGTAGRQVDHRNIKASRALWATGMTFYGPSGVGLASSYDEYSAHVLGPMWSAFAQRRFELDVIACEGGYCGAHGHLVGTHVGCYLGAWPSTPLKPAEVRMRVGLHWHVVDGLAVTGYMMHDAPALFRDHFGTDLLARASSGEPLPAACPPHPLSPSTLTAATIGRGGDDAGVSRHSGVGVDRGPRSFDAMSAALGAAAAVLLLGGLAAMAVMLRSSQGGWRARRTLTLATPLLAAEADNTAERRESI